MPTFGDFNYYFITDVLNISTFLINISVAYIGMLILVVPFIYQEYLKDYSFGFIFMLSQIIYAFAGIIGLSLSLRYTYELGISDSFLFVFMGLMESLEHGLTIMPSDILVAKITPLGSEGTIMSISKTIISLN